MSTGADRLSAWTVLRDPVRSLRAVAIDTGIVKRIDAAQWTWLEAALERARGKFIMAVLGHPFYAVSTTWRMGTSRSRGSSACSSIME